MRIVTFDQASAKTGYAVFSDTDLTRWGVIDVSKNKDLIPRLANMCVQIDTIIEKTKPDIVVFEGVNLRTSVRTLITLAQIQGCIMQSCFLKNIEFTEYAPVSWRKIIGITQNNKIQRKELKEQAIAFVRDGYKINVGEDCAEAICLGLAHLKKNDLLPDLNDLKRSKKNKENINE